MMLAAYRGLTKAAGPLILLALRLRRRRGKEHAVRAGERIGRPGLARPEGRLIWLHAASVGEAISLLRLIERLQVGYTVLLTTGTVASAELMARRLPDGALHQFVPIDRLAWVRRFLDHWRPDLALWAESEFWPNLLTETARRSVPMILLNGRVSDRSFARWQRLPGLIGPMLAAFVLCLGQTGRDAERLRALGAANAATVGNLKFAAAPLHADPKALAALALQLADRPRWLAASTHEGEELLAGRVHRRLAAEFPTLVSLIAPRHPERGDAIARALTEAGFTVSRRSLGEPIAPATEIYLADSFGEFGLLFRLVPVVWMGKSLIGRGGQNPLEPARLGAAVLFGPHMGNFVDIAERMAQAGAAFRVADEADLATAVRARLAEPARARDEGLAASRFASAEDGVLDAVLGAIATWLP
jgi:3-deoxy-D-manno-octulosonic-acid transferase